MPAQQLSSGTQRTHPPLGCSTSTRSRTTRTKSGSKWRREGGGGWVGGRERGREDRWVGEREGRRMGGWMKGREKRWEGG